MERFRKICFWLSISYFLVFFAVWLVVPGENWDFIPANRSLVLQVLLVLHAVALLALVFGWTKPTDTILIATSKILTVVGSQLLMVVLFGFSLMGDGACSYGESQVLYTNKLDKGQVIEDRLLHCGMMSDKNTTHHFFRVRNILNIVTLSTETDTTHLDKQVWERVGEQ